MSASESPLSEQARDLFEGMTWELEYLIRQFDPSGKDSDWNDARRLVEKARCEALVKESSTTDHSGEANKMVEDHFPDATKMTKLEAQNRELVEKVVELQLWKDTWMKVEAEWSPNELAGLLGGKLGERQRVVIQREVPKLVKDLRDRERERDHANDTASAVLAENNKLVEKVKRLEKAGNEVVYWFSPMAKHQLTPLHLAALNQWNEAKETKP